MLANWTWEIIIKDIAKIIRLIDKRTVCLGYHCLVATSELMDGVDAVLLEAEHDAEKGMKLIADLKEKYDSKVEPARSQVNDVIKLLAPYCAPREEKK